MDRDSAPAEQLADDSTALMVPAPVPAPAPEATLTPSDALDAWDQSKRRLSVLLRETEPDAAWLEQFEAATTRLRALARRDPDVALYVLLQAAASEPDRYSSHHAMLCAVVGELCAGWLEWPAEEVDALVRAALTMNLSMSVMQDALACQIGPLSAAQRERVDGHAARSAQLLTDAGVTDSLWIEVVRRHHDETPAPSGGQEPAVERLARLLHRVDVYTAKLSRRATREPASPAIAARDACLDAAGLPDPIGATMLRMLGLYPPGCFVLLANGETGVVIRRGDKAHTPVVAALRRGDGGVHLRPVRRDTSARREAVVHGVTSLQVKVHLNHERALSAD